MYKKAPARCKITDRTLDWRVRKYMKAFEDKKVKFDYSPEDKDLFYEVYDEVGSEYSFVCVDDRQHRFRNIPDGQFNVVYGDPPWNYYNKTNYSPDQHYLVLSTKAICSLNVPSANDAVLFLWVTNPFLVDGLQVMRAWGFQYKTNMVWVKDRPTTGFYVMGQHELLLIGVKGRIGTPLAKNRPRSVLNASKTKHSEKPHAVYDLIEKMYPNAQYLELFARNKREGWTAWGNEI